MKTLLYEFGQGVDAMTDRRMLPSGFMVVADNVDLRSGYPKPVTAPSVYLPASVGTTCIWEFLGKWFTSDHYRTYAGEALSTQTRVYWAEEGPSHTGPQKVVNDVQAPLGTFVPTAGPLLSTGSSASPSNLSLVAGAAGSLAPSQQYGYRVSANTTQGALPACGTVVVSLGAHDSSVALTWSPVAEATSYTIFGRSAGKEQVITANWGSTSFLDDGSLTPSGTFASAYDVSAAYQYLYTYVRSVGTMQDESGPSPITATSSTSFGRVVTRLVSSDGFYDGASTYSAAIATGFNQYFGQITGVLPTAGGSIVTVMNPLQGPWLPGALLRLTRGASPGGGNGTDLSPGGAGVSFVVSEPLVTPSAPVAGTPSGASGLAAGTYIWKVAAILGATIVVATTDPATTAASAASASTTIGSAMTIPVSWTPVLNASGYRLYRSADAGSTWAQVITVGQSITGHADDGTNEATGVTPPATDSTGTRCLLLPIDCSAYITPTQYGATAFWSVLQGIVATLPTPQTIADGDAILFSGCAQSVLNTQYGATLYQATAMATANVSVSSPSSASFDGYNITTGQTVLLTGQTAPAENGPWVFKGISTPMARPIWFSNGASILVTDITSIHITNGAVHGKTYQRCTTAGTITVGTSGTAWAVTTTTKSFLIQAYVLATDTASTIQWTTGNNFITSWRLYRTGDTASFLLVAEIPITEVSFTDFVPVTALGQSLPTSYISNGVVVTFKPPPENLKYIELYNGMLFGVSGNTVRWTPIGEPDAWPDAFTVDMSYPPSGLSAFASGLIILPPDAIYRLDGFDPTQMSLQRTYAEDGCIAPRSIQKTARGLAYLAKRGLMLFDGTSSVCLTEGKLPYKFLIQPSTYTAPWTAQNYFWFTTDHTAQYAQLSWANNDPLYSANLISYTVANTVPIDGLLNGPRSFVYRNKYYLFYSSADSNFAANTTVCIDLGAPNYPISTLGAKIVDAHVSSLDDAFVLLAGAPPDMAVSIKAPLNGGLALSSVATTYTALAVTGPSGGTYDGPYTYSWAFDDLGTGSGASVTHTWTTSGVHVGTVSAVNSTTHQAATAFVSVKVISQWLTEAATIPAFNGIEYGPHVHPLTPGTSLIIGADASNSIGNACYIYDNAANTVTATGSIPASRTAQSEYNSVVLSDANILISGGISGANGTKHAYIYSKVAGTWSQVADRSFPVSAGSVYGDVLLPSGKVFSSVGDATFGGADEIYDPVANAWTTLPTRPVTAYNYPSVALMGNGKVFRGPGIGDSLTACVAYDPIGNSWTTLTACPFSNALIVAMANGKLLAVKIDSLANAACSVYDPVANTWTAAATLPTETSAGVIVYPMPDGSVFVVGGVFPGGSSINLASYRYDPVANTWTTYPSTSKARLGSGLVATNGTVAVIGAHNTASPDGRTTIEYLA